MERGSIVVLEILVCGGLKIVQIQKFKKCCSPSCCLFLPSKDFKCYQMNHLQLGLDGWPSFLEVLDHNVWSKASWLHNILYTSEGRQDRECLRGCFITFRFFEFSEFAQSLNCHKHMGQNNCSSMAVYYTTFHHLSLLAFWADGIQLLKVSQLAVLMVWWWAHTSQYGYSWWVKLFHMEIGYDGNTQKDWLSIASPTKISCFTVLMSPTGSGRPTLQSHTFLNVDINNIISSFTRRQISTLSLLGLVLPQSRPMFFK